MGDTWAMKRATCWRSQCLLLTVNNAGHLEGRWNWKWQQLSVTSWDDPSRGQASGPPRDYVRCASATIEDIRPQQTSNSLLHKSVWRLGIGEHGGWIVQGCDVRSDLGTEGPRRPSVGVSYPIIISVLIMDLPSPLMSSLYMFGCPGPSMRSRCGTSISISANQRTASTKSSQGSLWWFRASSQLGPLLTTC